MNLKQLLLTLSFIGLFLIPNVSSAQTVTQLQALKASLEAQIAQLQAQLAAIQGGGTIGSGSTHFKMALE